MGHCSTGIREISYSPELRLSQLCQSKYFISVVHLLWKRNKLKGQRTLHTYLRTGEYLRSNVSSKSSWKLKTMGSSTQAPLCFKQGPVTLTNLPHTMLVVSILVIVIELEIVTVETIGLGETLEKRLGGSKKSLLLGREAAELGESDELVIENRNANNTSNKTQDDIIFPN